MIFQSIAVSLIPVNICYVMRPEDGVFAHSFIVNAISSIDAYYGRLLHNEGKNRHKAISLFQEQCEDDRQKYILRLSFFSDNSPLYINIIIRHFNKNGEVIIGKNRFLVDSVDMGNGRWSALNTWDDFFKEPQSKKNLFEFITPTAFVKFNNETKKRYFAYLPDPINVFTYLIKFWKRLDGPCLADGIEKYIQSGGCVISSLRDIRTVAFRKDGIVQKGFIGSVVYECLDLKPEIIASLSALSRFSFFTGIGYQAARSMGCVRTSSMS